MEDMFISYHNTYPVGEDNSVAQIIAHAGKLTPNICHIATKKQALQEHVHHHQVSFHRVSPAHNKADNFIKALP